MKMEVSILIGWLLLACNPTSPEFSKGDEPAIDLVYDLFSKAYQDLDIGLVDSIYVDNAIYLSPGDSIRFGKDQFMDSFRQMFENSKADSAVLAIDFQIVDRQIIDNQAIDIGYYHLQQSRDGQLRFTDVGKFMTVLKKQTNGHWKFIVDGYSQAPLDAWMKDD
jgi:ketosteroid isomerase-like protein